LLTAAHPLVFLRSLFFGEYVSGLAGGSLMALEDRESECGCSGKGRIIADPFGLEN
jgi:hypothetical protein